MQDDTRKDIDAYGFGMKKIGIGDMAMIPFSYAVIDSDGEVIRQYRWSVKEAKWHKEQGKNVVKLDKPIEVKEDLFKLVGECLF